MKNKLKVMLLLMLLATCYGNVGFGQTFKCGTDLSIHTTQSLFENRKTNSSGNYKSNHKMTIAIGAFIINDDITLDQMAFEIDRLNINFQSANIEFVLCDVILANIGNYNPEIGLLPAIDPASNLLNMYFFPDVKYNGATVYGASHAYSNFVVVNNQAFAGGVAFFPGTLTHEVGHYLGLLHTFETIMGVEHPQRMGNCVNCHEDGDGFCSTNADTEANNNFDNLGCDNNISDRFCDSQPYAYTPPCDNFMSYYGWTMNSFTNEQIDAMRHHRQTIRYTIQDNCDAPPIDGGDPPDFTCDGFCVLNAEDYLAIGCDDVSLVTGDDFIRPEGIRVYNLSSNPVRDVDVVFNLVGANNHRLHTVTIPVIEAGNYRDLDPAPISTIGVSDGEYTLELRLEDAVDIFSDHQTFHVCSSIQTISVSQPIDPCEETKTSRSVMPPNRPTTFEVSRYVELLPGFVADSEVGTVFTAQISPCSNAVQDESEVNAEQALIIDNPDASNTVVESLSLQHTIDPDHFESFQISNYPNPFSEKSTIELTLNKSDQVRITMSDLNGKLLKDIKEAGTLSEGNYQFTVDASQYQPGIYYYTVIVGAEQKTGKMILIK